MDVEAYEKECDKFALDLIQFLNEKGYPKNVVMRIFGDYLKQLIEETEDPEYGKKCYTAYLNDNIENLEV